MAKDEIRQWSTTAGNNTDIDGTSIAENCAIANWNNAMRSVMADTKAFWDNGFGYPTDKSGDFTADATDNQTATTNDNWRFFNCTATLNITLPAATSTTAGWGFLAHNSSSSGTVTVTRASTDTINGGTAIIIGAGESVLVKRTSSSAYRAMRLTQVQADGNELRPLQTAFMAQNSVSDTNQTGNGASATVDFNTVVFDQNSDFSADTFRAPVTGRYLLGCIVLLEDLTAAMTTGNIAIVTSSRTYNVFRGDLGGMRGNDNRARFNGTILADMDADDTATVTVLISNGAGDTVTIAANSTFWGVLIA